MKKVLLDTDIFSEIRKGINPVVFNRAKFYLWEFGFYTISMITVTEIVKGWHKLKREDKIEQFLIDIKAAEILTLDQKSSELSGRISADLEKIGQPIGLADSLIASIAIANNLVLVTGNTAHYQRIQKLGYELNLDNWRI
ncbi:MAG: PIN domain-containing protein [Dolichospermum sp.]